MLKVEQLSKKIDRQTILDAVDFTVESGEIIALIGRNGAGKTTLLRTMVGIIRPDMGLSLIHI